VIAFFYSLQHCHLLLRFCDSFLDVHLVIVNNVLTSQMLYDSTAFELPLTPFSRTVILSRRQDMAYNPRSLLHAASFQHSSSRVNREEVHVRQPAE